MTFPEQFCGGVSCCEHYTGMIYPTINPNLLLFYNGQRLFACVRRYNFFEHEQENELCKLTQNNVLK